MRSRSYPGKHHSRMKGQMCPEAPSTMGSWNSKRFSRVAEQKCTGWGSCSREESRSQMTGVFVCESEWANKKCLRGGRWQLKAWGLWRKFGVADVPIGRESQMRKPREGQHHWGWVQVGHHECTSYPTGDGFSSNSQNLGLGYLKKANLSSYKFMLCMPQIYMSYVFRGYI